MYNTTSLQAFIDKVEKEAEQAAQTVFDKYNAELIKMIQAELHPKDKLMVGNGTALLTRAGKDRDCNGFDAVVSGTQYCPEFKAGFNVPYIITKTKTKD